jgi:uncharacterized membrane protein YdjX (TVP38/TMEM64 family)
MPAASQSSPPNVPRKLLVGLAVAATIAVGFVLLRDVLSLASLARYESQLRAFQQRSPVAAYGLAVAAYVGVTGLSLPGATGLTLAYAWFFGFWRALVLVSFASTAGATLAFLVSRYLFRDAMRLRLGERLKNVNELLARDGPFYLFTLRLIPAVPFFVINAAMGLTPLPVRTFWWVSQLGMLPGTGVYVYAGSRVPSLDALASQGIQGVFTPAQIAQILAAFALLGVFPLAVRWMLRRWGPQRPAGTAGAPDEP